MRNDLMARLSLIKSKCFIALLSLSLIIFFSFLFYSYAIKKIDFSSFFEGKLNYLDVDELLSVSFENKMDDSFCVFDDQERLREFVSFTKESRVGFTSHVVPIEEYMITINFKNKNKNKNKNKIQYKGLVFNRHPNSFYFEDLPIIRGDTEWGLGVNTYFVANGRIKLNNSLFMKGCL